MTRFKWLNRWIEADMTTLHVLLAVFFTILYITGCFLPARQLMRIGYIGIFVLILVHLLHLHLHASDLFLSMHLSTDQIPKAQMNRVNGVCLAIFLVFTAIMMAIVPHFQPNRLIGWLKDGLLAILRFLAGLIPIPDASEKGLESTPVSPFVPPVMGEAVSESSLFARILDAVLAIIAVVVMITVLALLIRRLFFLAASLFKPRYDGDEKEFVKPNVLTGKTAKNKRAGKPLWRDFSINGRIRKVYKKEILTRQESGREQLFSDTPAELEIRTGFDREGEIREVFHHLYEKARYSDTGCTKEELEQLNVLKSTKNSKKP